MIKILIGGSPCQKWSVAQKNNRETEPSGIGWELFENYLIAKEKFQPDFFLYENNKSAAQPIKDEIHKQLGGYFTYINSALVSAQNRQRFHVTNFPVEQPEDRGILLKDILESGCPWQDKSYALTTRCHDAIPDDTLKRHRHTMAAEPVAVSCRGREKQGEKAAYYEGRADGKTYPVYEVKNGLITIKDKQYPIKLLDGYYIIRKLTVTECCRLQTLPDDYCRAVSATQGYKGLGNGWTAEVIIHILKHANIPLDEEILVLSMYDGIGTGRYCLDKMGYKNVKYYAYEIDKYAMQIAQSNYPDIIQCGDAFQVRKDDWQNGNR